MSTPSNQPDAAEIERLRGDEVDTDQDVRTELPDELDLPLEVAEADAIDQHREVPVADDDVDR